MLHLQITELFVFSSVTYKKFKLWKHL